MYSNCLKIFHTMKVIIAMGLEGRIAQETLDLFISSSFSMVANRAFINEQNRAIMLVSEDGKFGNAWLKRNACADFLQTVEIGAPMHNSSLIDVREEDLLKEFAAGRLNENSSTCTLLDKVGKKSNAKNLLEQV